MSIDVNTGLDPLECSILRSFGAVEAWAGNQYQKSSNTIRNAYEVDGYGPFYAWQLTCLLAHLWEVPLPLIDGHGNLGSGSYPAAPPYVTESRLTPAGELALASHKGELGPLPIGLINGDIYKGGTRLAFEPLNITRALIQLLDDPELPKAVIAEQLGRPYFFRANDPDGDLEAAFAGLPTTLTLRTSFAVEINEDGVDLVATNFPSQEISERFAEEIVAWTDLPYAPDELESIPEGPSPIAEANDMTSGAIGQAIPIVKLRLHPWADSDRTIKLLRNHPAAVQHYKIDMKQPVAETLREWAVLHQGEKTRESLAALLTVLHT